jgi:prevent-host-death family protein
MTARRELTRPPPEAHDRVMETISIEDAKDRLAQLVADVQRGETVVLTRDGEPVARLVPTLRKAGGLRLEALAQYKREHGIDAFFGPIPEDFDAPLPEDILLRPLPPLE